MLPAIIVTWFLVMSNFFVLDAASVAAGTYSFSSQLTTKKRKAIDSLRLSLYDEQVYGSWSKENEEFSLNATGVCEDSALEASTLLQMVQRILKGSEIFSDAVEKTKLAVDMNTCVIELPGKIILPHTLL